MRRNAARPAIEDHRTRNAIVPTGEASRLPAQQNYCPHPVNFAASMSTSLKSEGRYTNVHNALILSPHNGRFLAIVILNPIFVHPAPVSPPSLVIS